ncbi:hypothetical protein [Phenylobacterium immobile]|uniref:hypothetical protein n=1 Tax=Phenylobacterium immobile TaxID=21 RepID=UPI000B320FED|nr:hypothetical protein [Phenylobacterium immobile]
MVDEAPDSAGPSKPEPGPPILTAQALRKAARAHSRAALDALAAVAGNANDSPAARISAANAILDRAFGKSRAEGAGDTDRPRPKVDRRYENVIVYPPAGGWD